MDIVETAGRVLFVAIFALSGLNHLRNREAMAAYARGSGAPAPELTVLMIMAGAVLVGIGLWADLGALLIAAFVFPTAYFMHGFWRFDDPSERMTQQIHFQKNVSMGGAALVLFYLFNQFGPEVGLTVGDGRLFPSI